jgi:hypothetical protein
MLNDFVRGCDLENSFVPYCRATQSIGMLSFSFLRQTGHDDIVVPMVCMSSAFQNPYLFGCPNPSEHLFLCNSYQ